MNREIIKIFLNLKLKEIFFIIIVLFISLLFLGLLGVLCYIFYYLLRKIFNFNNDTVILLLFLIFCVPSTLYLLFSWIRYNIKQAERINKIKNAGHKIKIWKFRFKELIK